MAKSVFIPTCPSCEAESSLVLADDMKVECKKCKAVVLELHEHGDWVHGFGSLYQEYEDVDGVFFPVEHDQEDGDDQDDDDQEGDEDEMGL